MSQEKYKSSVMNSLINYFDEDGISRLGLWADRLIRCDYRSNYYDIKLWGEVLNVTAVVLNEYDRIRGIKYDTGVIDDMIEFITDESNSVVGFARRVKT